MNIEQTPLGYFIRTPEVEIFFGGVHSQLPQLQEAHPNLEFVRVKQIHSDVVVESNDVKADYQILADAHFTKEKNLALCVITADCVPVFFFDQQTGIVAGVHAGWRGVANRIIPKTIQALKAQGVNPENLDVVIGPHIQKASFEVGFDVRDLILASLGPVPESEKSLYTESLGNQKALVDLNKVVKTQLSQEGIEIGRVFGLHMDTFADPLFHSHRRDKEKAGRQISFICRVK